MGVSKDGTITIDGEDFMKGIGDSPYTGNGFMKHCDIYSRPGVLRATGLTSALSFNTNPTGKFVNLFTDDDGDSWGVTATNELYKITVSAAKITPTTGTPTTGTVEGVINWKGFIFIFLTNKVDVYDPTGDVWYPNWSSGDFSLATYGFKPGIVSSGDILYFGNGNIIYSITEDTTFDPSDAGTYTVEEALDLPEGYKIKCLAEYNNNLAIGTWRGDSITDLAVANLYFWDFVSTSFDGPLKLNEYGINQLLTVNNLLYIVAGLRHNIYISNGVAVEGPKELYMLNPGASAFITPKPNAIMYYKNKIYTATGSDTATTSNYDRPLGVYSLDKNNVLAYQNTISTEESNGGIDITALLPFGNYRYLMAWYDSENTPNYGIDFQSDIYPYGSGFSNLGAEFESRLYTVGTKINKKTFQEIEVQLTNKLDNDNQSISVYYREFTEDNWTQVGSEITEANHPNFNSFIFPFAPTLESIQVKVIIDDHYLSNSKIELKRIIIK